MSAAAPSPPGASALNVVLSWNTDVPFAGQVTAGTVTLAFAFVNAWLRCPIQPALLVLLPFAAEAGDAPSANATQPMETAVRNFFTAPRYCRRVGTYRRR